MSLEGDILSVQNSSSFVYLLSPTDFGGFVWAGEAGHLTASTSMFGFTYSASMYDS